MMKNRYEQEIEQLLSELESAPPDPARVPAPDDVPPPDDQPSPFAPRPRRRIRLISPTKLALAGAVLAVLGLLLPVKVTWLSLAGLVIMIAAIGWMFIQRLGSQPQQYWRGRPVAEEPPGAWQRLRRWLAK